MWNYESLFVPGLLQTADDAHAVVRAGLPNVSDDEVGRRVEVRMQRQQILVGESPLELWAIVDEAALRRKVGGPDVMRTQLDHLIEVTIAVPQVTLQVIPYTAGAHAGMLGSFVLMQFEDVAIPDVVYLDTMAGDLFLEADAELRRFRLAFEHLRAVAMSPDSSRELFATIRDQM